MANITCNFTIPAGGNGGQLTGQGFGAGNPPSLSANDTLTVKVQWAGNSATAPSSLTAYYVFSQAPNANQIAPSPFLQDDNYVCFKTASASRDANSTPATYTFPALTYSGGLVGRYELTFVAEAYTSTPSCIQWSDDPEFDTSN